MPYLKRLLYLSPGPLPLIVARMSVRVTDPTGRPVSRQKSASAASLNETGIEPRLRIQAPTKFACEA